MAPKKGKARRSSGGAKLPKKKCAIGLMVKTKAGLIGVTTGKCAARRVEVALMGVGPREFTRGQLRKLSKGAQARIKKELMVTAAKTKAAKVVKAIRTKGGHAYFPEGHPARAGEPYFDAAARTWQTSPVRPAPVLPSADAMWDQYNSGL